MKKINSKGITLVALVVTIIVIIILTGVTIQLSVGQNGIITRASDVKKESEVSTIKELLSLEFTIVEDGIKYPKYLNTDQVDEIVGNSNQTYKSKIGVYRGQLMYLDSETSENAMFLETRGFKTINMTPTEFKYYIEMGVLEDSVQSNKRIGRELQTPEFPGTISIGNNTYGIGWFLVGNYTEEEKQNNTYNQQFEELKLEDTTHAPYLVNYETGVVLSIDGMIMYESQVTVHSFNDNYDQNMQNSITYVNSYTDKTGESYGNLISTSIYDGEVTSYGGGIKIYQDNDGQLQYDEDGALLLDEDNAIPVLEVTGESSIKDAYSINVTVEGDYTQKNVLPQDSYANTIVALSDASSQYLSWIGVYDGFLQVYAYYNGPAVPRVSSEVTRTSFTSIDLSKYQGKPINIQVTATRGKTAQVYINGEEVRSFNVGNSELEMSYTTLGDLRVGRNLKFVGKIYEFGIYNIAIDESGVQSNWERAKRYVEN